HPNLIRILDVDQVQGQYYIMMEDAQFGSLRSLLEQQQKARTRLPLELAADLIRQAAAGASALNSAGMIHGNLKPENILLLKRSDSLKPGSLIVKLSDGGLGELLQSAGSTQGAMLSSPAYMSPEQCKYVSLVPASDVYTLGTVLYEALTGLLPFEIRNLGDALRKHLSEPPKSPRVLVPELSPALEDVLMRCLQKEPERRFANLPELVKALDAALKPPAPPPAPNKPSVKPVFEQPTLALGGQAAAGQNKEVFEMPTMALGGQAAMLPRVRVVDDQGKEYPPLPLSPMKALTVGRQDGCDYVLDSKMVSRKHLQLEWKNGQAWVMDVGSSSGSFVDGTPLMAQQPRVWRMGELVQLGNFFLSLEPPQAAARPAVAELDPDKTQLPTGPLPPPPPKREGLTKPPSQNMHEPVPSFKDMLDPSFEPAAASSAVLDFAALHGQGSRAPSTSQKGGFPPAGAGELSVVFDPKKKPPEVAAAPVGEEAVRVALSIDKAEVQLEPGRSTAVVVTVSNLSNNVAHLTLIFEGIPAEWVRLEPAEVRLMNSAQSKITVMLTAPRVPESRADEYPVLVRVKSSNPERPVQSDALPMRVTVLPFFNSKTTLDPERLNARRNGTQKVEIQNLGNTPMVFNLDGKDQDKAFRYSFEPSTLRIDPGKTASSTMRVDAPLHLMGAAKTHPFSVNIQTQVAHDVSASVSNMARQALGGLNGGNPMAGLSLPSVGSIFNHRPMVPLWGPVAFGIFLAAFLWLWKKNVPGEVLYFEVEPVLEAVPGAAPETQTNDSVCDRLVRARLDETSVLMLKLGLDKIPAEPILPDNIKPFRPVKVLNLKDVSVRLCWATVRGDLVTINDEKVGPEVPEDIRPVIPDEKSKDGTAKFVFKLKRGSFEQVLERKVQMMDPVCTVGEDADKFTRPTSAAKIEGGEKVRAGTEVTVIGRSPDNQFVYTTGAGIPAWIGANFVQHCFDVRRLREMGVGPYLARMEFLPKIVRPKTRVRFSWEVFNALEVYFDGNKFPSIVKGHPVLITEEKEFEIKAIGYDGKEVSLGKQKVTPQEPEEGGGGGGGGGGPAPTPTAAPLPVSMPITTVRPFKLEQGVSSFYFEPSMTGKVGFSAGWDGSQKNLTLVFEDGRANQFFRDEHTYAGDKKIEKDFELTREQYVLTREKPVYRVVVQNPGRGAADGTLNLTYPNRLGPQGDALNGRFSVRKEVSTVSQVVEVSSPGELKAKATWAGYDQKLSLLVFGPGQVNEYARKEDKSGVTVAFKITPELLKLGNVWYVQLRHDASSQGLLKDLLQLFKTQAGLQGEMTLEIP
ncbi:MAG: protein kinase domain-containing protein, partial [Myxococcota bacterium]